MKNSKNETKKIKKIEKLSKAKKSVVKDEKPVIVSVKRSKSKKGKGKSRRSKESSSNGALSFKLKYNYMVNVATDMRSGVEITDDGSSILKTKGKGARNYAILDGDESHSIAISSLKNKKEGKAMLKFEKIRVSSEIKADKRRYRVINAPVVMSDARSVCEKYGYELAELHESDVLAVADKAGEYIRAQRAEMWIDSMVPATPLTKEEKKARSESLLGGVQIPGVFNAQNLISAPIADEIAASVNAKLEKAVEALRKHEENEHKQKKVLKEHRDKIRKFTNDFLGKNDPTARRIVLCRTN